MTGERSLGWRHTVPTLALLILLVVLATGQVSAATQSDAQTTQGAAIETGDLVKTTANATGYRSGVPVTVEKGRFATVRGGPTPWNDDTWYELRVVANGESYLVWVARSNLTVATPQSTESSFTVGHTVTFERNATVWNDGVWQLLQPGDVDDMGVKLIGDSLVYQGKRWWKVRAMSTDDEMLTMWVPEESFALKDGENQYRYNIHNGEDVLTRRHSTAYAGEDKIGLSAGLYGVVTSDPFPYDDSWWYEVTIVRNGEVVDAWIAEERDGTRILKEQIDSDAEFATDDDVIVRVGSTIWFNEDQEWRHTDMHLNGTVQKRGTDYAGRTWYLVEIDGTEAAAYKDTTAWVAGRSLVSADNENCRERFDRPCL